MDLLERSRRLRGTPILRELVRETRCSKSSLIYPMFVKEGTNIKEEIPSMQGQYRYSPDTLLFELEHLSNIGIRSVMLAFQIIKMLILQAPMHKTVLFKLLCSLQKKNSQTYIILLTSAYANIPLTVIAECSAVKP